MLVCKNTWLRSVKNACIVSDKKHGKNTIVIDSIGYEKLTEKSLKMWSEIYKKFYKKYKFFIKIDDDTFFSPPTFFKNLCPNKKQIDFLGDVSFWSKKNKREEKWVAGSFYMLSLQALKALIMSKKKDLKKAVRFGPAEDFAISLLLLKKKIKIFKYPYHLISFPMRKIYQLPNRISSISNLSPLKMCFLFLLEKILKTVGSFGIFLRKTNLLTIHI